MSILTSLFKITTVGKPYMVGTSNLLRMLNSCRASFLMLVAFDNNIFGKTTILLTNPTIKFFWSILATILS